MAIAAQKKRDESYTVAETAAGGSLKRVRANSGAPTRCGQFFNGFRVVSPGLAIFPNLGDKFLFGCG